MKVIIGPPGTGKTTTLARRAKRSVEEHGKDKVLICSLTKQAAAEVADRDTGVDPAGVGTLHSHALRGLGEAKIVAERHVKQWNEEHPQWRRSFGMLRTPDGIDSKGDQVAGAVDRLRAECVDPVAWPRHVRKYHDAWEDFKRQGDLLDFTDLIEKAHDECIVAPGSPRSIYVDEAQDLSNLELKLIKAWGLSASDVTLIGDPDQSLFGWRGASRSALQHPGAEVEVLSQSYRVPRAVHAVACSILTPTGTYRPCDRPGEVVRHHSSFKDFEYTHWTSVEEAVEDGKSVMVISATGITLLPAIRALISRGIPFHNPAAPQNYSWNPLNYKAVRHFKAYCVAAAERRDWTVKEVKRWVQLLDSSHLKRGGIKHFAEAQFDDPRRELRHWLKEEHAWMADRVDPVLFASSVSAAHLEHLKLPTRIITEDGVERLFDKPSVTVSTIHSSKGGEADLVILSPDLGYKFYDMSNKPGWHGREAIKRMFYVAATRARERLIVAAPGHRSEFINLPG